MRYLHLAIIGFVIGLLARIIMTGRDPMGIIMTVLLGLGGSYLGAFAADYFSIAVGQFHLQLHGISHFALVLRFHIIGYFLGVLKRNL